MAQEAVVVQQRSVLGKRVHRLRRDGVLPANIYGRGLESMPVQLDAREALTMLRTHGLNNLFTIRVDGEGEPRSVVVRDVDRHPTTREVRHIDFFQVDLTRPIQAAVPIVLTGDAPAVQRHGGILVTGIDSVLVDALPGDLPSTIETSVESLTELDAVLTVGDISFPEGVTPLTDPEIAIARIARPRLILSAADEEEAAEEAEEAAENAQEAVGDGE